VAGHAVQTIRRLLTMLVVTVDFVMAIAILATLKNSD